MRLSTLLGLLAHGIVIDSPYDFTAVKLVAGGFQIRLDASGNLGFFDSSGTEIIFFNGSIDVKVGAIMNFRPGIAGADSLTLNQTVLPKSVTRYGGSSSITQGLGLAPILGLDNRSGITAADGAPITLYSVPAGANQLFDAAIEIDATAYTSGTATYTLTYTENGVAQTVVVTATVINTVTGVRRLIQPDPSTLITVQLTGAFVATLRLSAAVMQLA